MLREGLRKGQWVWVGGKVWEARPLVRIGTGWGVVVPKVVVDLLCTFADNKPWVLWREEDGVILIQPLRQEHLQEGGLEGAGEGEEDTIGPA